MGKILTTGLGVTKWLHISSPAVASLIPQKSPFAIQLHRSPLGLFRAFSTATSLGVMEEQQVSQWQQLEGDVVPLPGKVNPSPSHIRGLNAEEERVLMA